MTSWEHGLKIIADDLKSGYPQQETEIINLCAKIECLLRTKESKWSKKPKNSSR